MGNRCVITTPKRELGVYFHWNGGRDSVEPLLAYCKLKGYRTPETDDYGWARLCQVAGNCFGGTDSLGINTYNNLDTDNGDNGVYIIENWVIVDRLFCQYEQQEYDFLEMLIIINSNQPKAEQLSIEKLCEYAKEHKGYNTDKIKKVLLRCADECDKTEEDTKDELLNNINNLVEEKPKSIKSATLKTTLPVNARLKSLLHQIAIKYGVKLVIESEENFNVGLIFKTEFATVFFHFEGERAKEAFDTADKSIKDYIAKFRDE